MIYYVRVRVDGAAINCDPLESCLWLWRCLCLIFGLRAIPCLQQLSQLIGLRFISFFPAGPHAPCAGSIGAVIYCCRNANNKGKFLDFDFGTHAG